MATWVGYPASYSPGRSRPVQYVVIHSTQGSEGPTSAEDGAAYDKRRTDGTSTHLFVDSNSAVREVPDADRAHHARYHGNEIGLGIELCGLAQQSDAQWHDANSLPMLRIAAAETAQMCRDHGIPVRRLSVAQVRAAYYAAPADRPKGICGHVDVTAAYPEDEGSHWDPGPNFPWAEFLQMVTDELGDDMALTESEHYIQHVINYRIAGVIAMTDPVTSPAWTAPSGKIFPATSMPNSLAKAVLAGVAAELTPAQLAAIAAAAEAGAAAGAPSIDEIAAVVDRELDEQSLGGADQD